MHRGVHLAVGFVVAIVAAAPAIAHAGGSHKVTVQTEPSGAHVYVGDVESGAVCDKTPCSFDAPIGSVTLIVQLANYAPRIDQIDVPRRPKKPLIFNYKLDPAIGTIVIESPAAAKGATISVDDADKGKIKDTEQRVDIDPGGHHVVVELGKQSLYDSIINVDTGEEVPVKIAMPQVAAATATDSKPDDDSTTTTTPHDTASITTTARAPARSRYISGDVVVDVGFRRFSYQNPTSGPLAPESEDGQVIAGPAVEVWPMELAGWNHLRGLSLFAKLELPVNHQDVLDSNKQPIGPTTYWMTFEADIRQTWTASGIGSLEVSGGYVRDELRFNGDIADVMKLPDCDYQSVRLGARGILQLGAIEPYVALETRAVEDGGVLQTRFQQASATGFKGALGVAVHGGSFIGRVEASDLHYNWTLSQASQPGNFYGADSATDKVLGISFLLGYQY